LEKLPFIPDQIYNRQNDIHDLYGGNRQRGISPSARNNYIFIFYGKTGHQHGYIDGWDSPDVFSYTGEGQSGDMQFTVGNLALRDHLANGKRVFLFEFVKKGFVKFICELELFTLDYFETHDTSGKLRTGIKFFFKKVGVILSLQPAFFQDPLIIEEPKEKYIKFPDHTEKLTLVTSRVGQGAFRKSVILRWDSKCAVTGFNKLDLLIASHIVPWAKSTDNEKLDKNNGLLLSPTYNALFDRNFISFEDSGKIILSKQIETPAFQKIGVTGNEIIKNLSDDNFNYLERHRDGFAKGG
jgi:5-methylcytosine-specific restriction enzyme A